MKKILSITLVALMLSLSFVVSASAVPTTKQEVKYATFSDDFQTMFYDGKPYSRANTDGLYYYEDIEYSEYDEYDESDVYSDSYAMVTYEVSLSDSQKNIIKSIRLYSYNSAGSEVIFDAEIYYKDGATLMVSYLLNDYLNEYNKLMNKEFDEFYVNFGWPEGNIVPISKELLSSQITKNFDYWEYSDSFFVEGSVKNGKLRYSYGEIRYINGDFYYYNPELNKEAEEYFNDDAYYDDFSHGYETEPKVTLNLITDKATKEVLDEALKKYYEDDMGYIYNDELLEGVSKVFLTIMFGVIPFGVFITFLVLAIKVKKKCYKKIYIAGSVLSIAEVLTFIVTAIYIFK